MLAVVVVRLGFRSDPSTLGVRTLSAISAFCHDQLPNVFIFIPRAWQTNNISKLKVFSDRTQPEITPDRSSPPSDEINIENRRYLNSPSLCDASLADLQIKQEMEYLCNTKGDKLKRRLDSSRNWSPFHPQRKATTCQNCNRLPCSPSRRILTTQCPKRILNAFYPIYPISTFMGNSFVGHLSGQSF